MLTAVCRGSLKTNKYIMTAITGSNCCQALHGNIVQIWWMPFRLIQPHLTHQDQLLSWIFLSCVITEMFCLSAVFSSLISCCLLCVSGSETSWYKHCPIFVSQCQFKSQGGFLCSVFVTLFVLSLVCPGLKTPPATRPYPHHIQQSHSLWLKTKSRFRQENI